MDIKPPARPLQLPPVPPDMRPPTQPPQLPPQRPVQQSMPPSQEFSQPVPSEQIAAAPPPVEQPPLKKVSKKKRWFIALLSILTLGVIAIAAIWFWYQAQLAPVNSANKEKVVVKIAEGSTAGEFASVLKENNIIRNEDAFFWYTRLQGVQTQLKPGSYRLSPSESTTQIVEHLLKGNVDTFLITFYPGATLADAKTKLKNRLDVTSVLINAGYSQDEISLALNKQYDHPLFAGKPATADLEGYVLGDTYEVFAGSSVEDILKKTFDEFYSRVEEYDLISGYQSQGLSLYEGITLASIVQRESGGNDHAQIARVFYNRLEQGMTLGSDVTYQYIADKEGGVRDPNYDSPYNTRRYAGLPPGPIAVPNLDSLRAVAAPADSDYLFFLSGDDDVTYYGRTVEEHEANIRNHCQQKCLII